MQLKKIRNLIFIGAIIIMVVIVFIGLNQQPEVEEPFDNEGRYDSTVLNNMGVIYNNSLDIAHLNNGYSESANCPWGVPHNGLDYIFYNNSIVIAAAPGLVEEIYIGWQILPYHNIYWVSVQIKFNESVTINYGFEGNSADAAVWSQQEAMLDVEIGDWVAKGDQIGRFLRPTEYDHVHFSIYRYNQAICPRLVMGEDDYNEIMSMIHTFQPTWELCYP